MISTGLKKKKKIIIMMGGPGPRKNLILSLVHCISRYGRWSGWKNWDRKTEDRISPEYATTHAEPAFVQKTLPVKNLLLIRTFLMSQRV